jgi:hypothetical protein
MCAGAQWHSLDRLGKELSKLPKKERDPGNQLASSIACMASLRQINGIEGFQDSETETIPNYQKLHVAIGFHHLYLVEQFLLQEDLGRATYHCQQFIRSLEHAAVSLGEYWTDEEVKLIYITSQNLPARIHSQLLLAKSIRYGSLPSHLTFVLGMHRSGTSALSGLLIDAGYSAPMDLMAANDANPKGYWESMGLFQLNDALLASLGSDWKSVNSLPLGWEDYERTVQWRLDTMRHLERVFSSTGHPIIKDPRYCLLLPGLAPLLESNLIELSFLLTLRHPFEVSKSLKVRDSIPAYQGIRMWLLHVFNSEKLSRYFPRAFIEYNDLLSRPSEILVLCTKTIQGNLSMGFDSVNQTVDANLQHHKLDDIINSTLVDTNRNSTERAIAVQVFKLLSQQNQDLSNCLDHFSSLSIGSIRTS